MNRNKGSLKGFDILTGLVLDMSVLGQICSSSFSTLDSQQRQQNALKYVTDEWAGIEYELLRERGLWGPPIGSHLDKFQLDMTEGPCRMRKKMVRNDLFYIHYPYVPEQESGSSSHQVTMVTTSDTPCLLF